MTVETFVATALSNEPVPGGGSVAALSGALAAALAGMVANLTIGKKKYGDVEEEMTVIAEKMTAISESLTAMIDEDASSFDDVMKAFKMPKESDEEKALRTTAIQTGMKLAAEVPLQTASKSAELFDAIETVVVKGNTNAVTDGAVAAMMARTAILSALYNVKINLGSIKDEEYVAKMSARVSELEYIAMKREKDILDKVEL